MTPDPAPFHHPDPEPVEHGAISVFDEQLTMTGEIDTVVVLRWQARHPVLPVVRSVDATEVTFLGSAGVAYLIALHRPLAPARLEVRSGHPAVLRPITLMGLETVLDLRTS